jgi:hypothetical protein
VAADDAVFQVFSGISEVCFQVIYLNIAYVAMAIYTCCKYMFQVFQLFQTYVSSVFSGCCITCTLQAHDSSVSGVSYVCCKCFICMLQKIDLDVACVCNGFQVFSGVLQLFQTYSLRIGFRSRLGQRHGLQNTTLTSCFYKKNIYEKVIYVYFYESIFQDKSIHIIFIFANSTT